MKTSIRLFSCTLAVCLLFALSASAQQFKLSATPNATYYLDNIFDLRNTLSGRPAGLVQTRAVVGGLFGTSIQHYNTLNGLVVNPVFNYAIPGGVTVRNLKGSKFTEGLGSYFFTGTVEEVLAGGAIREQIFITRVNSATGIINVSRRIVLPTTLVKPSVSNILLIDNILYVSGTVVFNNRRHVFAFRTDVNVNALGWFRLYPLANREFYTFAQCLMNDGVNGLVLAGVDQTNGRSVVFKVNPVTGAVQGAVTAYSLCTLLSCRPINYVSIGRSGNFRDMFVQSTANALGDVLFNVSQMNATWTAPVVGTTHHTSNWSIRSVRFENTGVLLSHFDNTTQRYNRSVYNSATGVFAAGSGLVYLPPATDVTGIIRQIETILMPNNRTFSIGKYRDLPANTTRTLVELQPSLCQGAFGMQQAQETLRPQQDAIFSVLLQMPVLPLPTVIIPLPVNPIQICAFAPLAGEGVGDRSEETSETEIPTLSTDIQVSPNPLTQSMTVVLTENNIAEVSLFDLNGRSVQKWEFGGFENTANLDLPELVPGMYLLRVQDTDKKWHFKKVMKQ